MKHTLPIFAVVAALPAFAEEARQLDAHEHGVGVLNIAIDGKTVAMEFHAPGADIVGFEYAAESDADLAAIDAAIATLSAPLDLFAIPAASGCTVTEAQAELEGEEAHDEHGHEDHDEKHHDDEHHEEHAEEEHDDHGDEEHAEHAKEGHDDHGDEEHAEHAKEGHDDHGDEEHAEHAEEGHDDHDDKEHAEHSEEAGHTEFHAEYTLSCDNTEALDQITFAYFETFPNAKEIEVQIITASGAQAFEVERDAPVLDLGR